MARSRCGRSRTERLPALYPLVFEGTKKEAHPARFEALKPQPGRRSVAAGTEPPTLANEPRAKRGETLSPMETRDMSKTAPIIFSVDPKLLQSARRVLQHVGLNVFEAVALFLKQVVRQNGLPFDAGAANVEAREAEREAAPPAQRALRRPLAEDPLAPFFLACRKAAQAHK
jgi:addiction module RelB/DinJ family antitoxin